MSMSKKGVVLAILLPVAALCGCATTGGGASPAEEIVAGLADYHAAMSAKDMEGIVGRFSEDFESAQGGDKSTLEAYFQDLIDQGAYDDIEANMDACEISFEGDVATVGPVDYETGAGTTSWEYTMKKEADGAWRITYSEQL